MTKTLSRLMLIACLIPASGWAEYLQFSNQWVRAVPPHSKMTAAYADITNSSEFEIWITGASSEQFAAVELHETIERDGMARMVHRDFVKLSPGETVQFKRGGKHFMLFTPVSPVTEGDTYTINVILGNGDTESFSATVSRDAPQP